MLILQKRAIYFNPLFVDDRELANIVFYNKEGEVFSTGHGWFNAGNNFHKAVHINIETINKRKPDFSLNIAQLIPKKKEYYEKEGKKCILYLPYDFFEWKIKKRGRTRISPTKKDFYDVYFCQLIPDKTRVVWDMEVLINPPPIEGVFFSYEKFIKSEDKKENIEFIAKIKPIYALFSDKPINEYEIIPKKRKIIKTIKDVAKSL